MFSLAVFIISWAAWLIFADKRRWRELTPVSLFAALLGAQTDIIMHYYRLWEYDPALVVEILDDTGIYIVVTYLFIQWLPKNRSPRVMFGYWFVWTALAITVEFIFLATGHIHYHRWWNIGWSYLADWLLFGIFYLYHKVLRLEKLSR
jgi:hypothetical protein